MIIGYARVSSVGQDYTTQMERLKAAGAEKVYSEKRSGLDRERKELALAIEYAREGDVLVVTKLDRLARSTVDLYEIVSRLEAKGVAFKVLDDKDVDTSSRTGRFVMGILALIAQFETEIRKERQMEGIAKAKAEGRSGGRPRIVTDDKVSQVRELRESGQSLREIAKATGLSVGSVRGALVANVETAAA
jgi:DNA invertase Pin-like site-specific DNA recombinase